MKSFVLFSLILLGLLCCGEDDKSITSASDSRSIVGAWVYIERGYSPGSGYITEPVFIIPLQVIRFMPDLTMETNISDLTEFKYYRIYEDETRDAMMLSLFEEDPGQEFPLPNELRNTYYITWEDQKLKLHLRGCIEGCHIGLRRLTADGKHP